MAYQTESLISPEGHKETSGPRRGFSKFLIGVLLTGIILVLSGYALTTTPVLPRTLHVALGLMAVLFIWLVLTGKPLVTQGNWLPFAFAAILIGTALLSALLQANASLAGTLQVPVLILCGYLLAQAVPFDVFVNWFCGAMAVFSLVAVVAWLLFIVLAFPLVGGDVTNYNGAVYNNGLVYFLFVGWDGTPIDRSMGPFWEPGLFASFIVFALFSEISFRTGPVRKWIFVSLVLGIIVAQSTAGFLLVIPALALILLKRRSAITGFIAYLASLLALIAYSQLESIIRGLIAIDPELFGKLEQEALQSSTRMNVFDLNLDIFSESPLIGWGFEGANQEVWSRMATTGVAAQTSTSTYFLAAVGVVGLLYTFGWFAVLLDTNISVSERVTILICILVIINKEPHSAILVTFVYLFYFLSRMSTPAKLPYTVGQAATI